jgi:DNA-binding NarL/FixJ family response regulator
MSRINVVLVDDQQILLEGLKSILETDGEIHVVATANNGTSAITAVENYLPQVVLMDIRMPEMNGVECTKVIKQRWPNIAVLVLTTFDDGEYIVDALRFGASGYLLKDISGVKLIQAVKDAFNGDTILPSSVAARIAGKLSEETIDPSEKLKKVLGLSERETEIAVMLSQGFTNRQISTALFISEGTVRNYTSSIYSKLGVEDRTTAAIKIRGIVE